MRKSKKKNIIDVSENKNKYEDRKISEKNVTSVKKLKRKV